MREARRSRSPKAAALAGGLFLLPFVVTNAIVANRIEPFFSLIRPRADTSPFEYALLVAVLGCIPIGAFIAARPLFDRSENRKRGSFVVNGVLAAFMLIVFVMLSAGLGGEIYRCDVQRLANCD